MSRCFEKEDRTAAAQVGQQGTRPCWPQARRQPAIDWDYFTWPAGKENTTCGGQASLNCALRAFIAWHDRQQAGPAENAARQSWPSLHTRNRAVTEHQTKPYDQLRRASIRFVFRREPAPTGIAGATGPSSKSSAPPDGSADNCSRRPLCLPDGARCAGRQSRRAEVPPGTLRLACRQSSPALKLVPRSPDGELLLLSENGNNGSVGTVDITPSSPLFLCPYSPDWRGPDEPHLPLQRKRPVDQAFPAHDVGTYPWPTWPDLNDDMPIREADNMLCRDDAVSACAMEGSAATTCREALGHADHMVITSRPLRSRPRKPALRHFDDFTGHFAPQSNLSARRSSA